MVYLQYISNLWLFKIYGTETYTPVYLQNISSFKNRSLNHRNIDKYYKKNEYFDENKPLQNMGPPDH